MDGPWKSSLQLAVKRLKDFVVDVIVYVMCRAPAAQVACSVVWSRVAIEIDGGPGRAFHHLLFDVSEGEKERESVKMDGCQDLGQSKTLCCCVSGCYNHAMAQDTDSSGPAVAAGFPRPQRLSEWWTSMTEGPRSKKHGGSRRRDRGAETRVGSSGPIANHFLIKAGQQEMLDAKDRSLRTEAMGFPARRVRTKESLFWFLLFKPNYLNT
ncbi:hypothetical protein MAPG_05944 [Magnaporthiopsis poae ATCC 64411]|uniref:Uncharacterized protein n=1 Tax=Magnaporthiopsis poae (strain ATCC 64411 / 73-15) TaxID=644358 RepID=A0A0C4E0R2_MAGP6|nr:hypothetical protein MAPG_05944 [Magnaporthiopsis poae ATCC 64411]